ncbi:GyrI-like domain-containing protein, partial [Candidatus Fermentibacteria bacterium]|nr:GyrI-like domain-containing protein [Candidatus Fermentibacteria bacterium]
LSVRALPPARCRVIEHQGGLDTLAETLDYVYTWWLGGTDFEIAGPALIRLGRIPRDATSLELTLPLKAH